MHSQSNNKEIKINDKADEVIENFLKSLLNRYHINLELSMRGSNFIFDCVHLLCYKYYRINPKCGGFIYRSTVNPINKKYNKYFQYVVTVALNHQEI